MAIVFILITAKTASKNEIYNQLQKIQEVVELHPLYGEYDLIAKVKTEDDDNSKEAIIARIKSLEEVRDTKVFRGC